MIKSVSFESLISNNPIFLCLSTEERNQILQFASISTYEKNNIILSPAYKEDKVFFLMEGVIKLFTPEAEGKEVIKGILHPYAILGEESIVGELNNSNFATCMSETAEVLEVDTELVRNLMKNNFEFAMGFMKYLNSKIQDVEHRLESFVINDARERIVKFIRANAENYGKPIGFELLLRHNFTQQDIANYTGTSRQTVTTVLNELKKTNKIHFRRKAMLIRDMSALD